ncbi:hypothetical protein [Bradyrhizobium sp. F1.13.3]|uniref:hypothetical protein n=1 Tax=Bradyrhizobium sp. F1.13.3 TaxID=3156351 RepID=UPI0033907FD6
MKFLGRHHVKAFSHLLGKVLPLTIGADNPGANPVLAINITSIPAGHNEDGTPMAVASAPVIEHTPRPPMRVVSARPTRAELEALPIDELKAYARQKGFDVDGLVDDEDIIDGARRA